MRLGLELLGAWETDELTADNEGQDEEEGAERSQVEGSTFLLLKFQVFSTDWRVWIILNSPRSC